jgi:MFS family permease
MLVRGRFWLLYACYFCGVFAGVLVNSFAAPIAAELAAASGPGAAPDRAAASAVMLFAFASAGGRVLWGFLSDRFGRVFMIGAAFVLTAAAMFTLYAGLNAPGVFLPCLFAAGLCYGGIFGTFPSLSAESFGLKNAAVNLAILFSSFSLVAVLAPQVVAFYRSGGAGEYPKAFLAAGCVAVAGLILSALVGRTGRRK